MIAKLSHILVATYPSKSGSGEMATIKSGSLPYVSIWLPNMLSVECRRNEEVRNGLISRSCSEVHHFLSSKSDSALKLWSLS